MGRLSRGCLRCRQRRVSCDGGRPACSRCIKRNEVCEGYRDEATIIFRYETDKVIEHARAVQAVTPPSSQNSPSSPTRKRSKSVDTRSPSRQSSSPWSFDAATALAPIKASDIKLQNPLPWLKETPTQRIPPLEEQAVDQFMDKFVIYPCNETSSPGFLEHLPSMFKEVNVEGRYALRWAVQAAAYADISKDQENSVFASKALQCYGMALKALGASLATPGKQPDDHDLMTVVILDIFETLYTPEKVKKGSHAQGMAQILRLRGSDLVHNSRGWSLFRLAHHRIQKQQLTFNMPQVFETQELLNQLNDTEPFVRLEKNTHNINLTCKRAQTLLEFINKGDLPASTIVEMVEELHSLDQVAVSWRQTSQWSYIDLTIYERPDLEPAAREITDTIQLHSDMWMAYEWNYHRAARITFLQQLIECAEAAFEAPDLDIIDKLTLTNITTECVSIVQWLAHEILATVPQSFGDVNHMGQLHDSTNGPPRCRSIGGYLLLWPIKIIKAEASATAEEQKECANKAFERIREYTGMKALLGDKSII